MKITTLISIIIIVAIIAAISILFLPRLVPSNVNTFSSTVHFNYPKNWTLVYSTLNNSAIGVFSAQLTPSPLIGYVRYPNGSLVVGGPKINFTLITLNIIRTSDNLAQVYPKFIFNESKLITQGVQLADYPAVEGITFLNDSSLMPQGEAISIVSVGDGYVYLLSALTTNLYLNETLNALNLIKSSLKYK